MVFGCSKPSLKLVEKIAHEQWPEKCAQWRLGFKQFRPKATYWRLIATNQRLISTTVLANIVTK